MDEIKSMMNDYDMQSVVHALLIVLKPFVIQLRPLWEIIEKYRIGEGFLAYTIEGVKDLLAITLRESDLEEVNCIQRNLIE